MAPPQPPPQTAATNRPISDLISHPIILCDQINAAVKESTSYKFDCLEVSKRVDRLRSMLSSAARITATYDRPLLRIAGEVSKTLIKTLALVKKCRGRSVLSRVVAIVSAADFRKIFSLLDSSVADMKWILSIFESGGGNGIVLTLPPIASNDPILSWVWSYIACLYMGQLVERVEAANELASLAKDNDRNKQIIVDEGGISPLLKLLKDGSSTEGQFAAADALFALASDEVRVRSIVEESGVNVIVGALKDSPMRIQTKVADLVARMAEHSGEAKEEFACENAIRPLVTLLSSDLFVDERFGRQSLHSVVQISKEMERKNLHRMHYSEGSSSSRTGGTGNYKKERENEKPEVKHELKISCARALWMLARESIGNSRRIAETKGLLCLAKLVETEGGELRYNCLMTVMEITAAAETNADLRRAAFKMNSPAAKAVVNQLLRVIRELDDPSLIAVAIKAIGSLARTFPARETRVLGPLVAQLSHWNQEIGIEAAVSLGKFTSPDNFLRVEHAKTIIDFKGVPAVMRLLRSDNEKVTLHGLILTCHLAINAGKSEDLELAGLLSVFEGVDRAFVAQHPELKELIAMAIYHLSVYHRSHSGLLVQRPFLAA